MFNTAEWNMISRGLEMSAASCRRLSNREGQPVEVQQAYQKSLKELSELQVKVAAEAIKVKK